MALSLAAQQAIRYNHAISSPSSIYLLQSQFHLYTDSRSAMQLTEKAVLHQRAKHIDVHYYFTRECLPTQEELYPQLDPSGRKQGRCYDQGTEQGHIPPIERVDCGCIAGESALE